MNSPSSNNEKLEILTSCNGLLLLDTSEKDHFLLNPFTRSYKNAPGNLYHYRDKNNIRMYVNDETRTLAKVKVK